MGLFLQLWQKQFKSITNNEIQTIKKNTTYMEVKDKKESKLKKVKEKTLKVKETWSDSNVA